FTALAPQPAPLNNALHLVCAEDVISDIDVPGFESSAMDGYAVRSEDTSASTASTLTVIGEAPAGEAAAPTVTPDTAVKIMTGGRLPPGADAIVPWEDTEADGDRITVMRAPAP